MAITTNNPEGAFTPLTIKGATAVVTLTDGLHCLVDIGDWPIVSRHRWYATSAIRRRRYAETTVLFGHGRRTRVKKNVKMHRLLVSAAPGQLVDHRDRNGLNNRRKNLRVCDKTGNAANSDCRPGVTGFRGVRRQGKASWGAVIKVNQRPIHIGTFRSPADAAAAYDKAALAHFGEFATTNFSGQKTE